MAAYEQDRLCQEVDAARRAVERATIAYSRGGSLDALNKANRRLADADYALANPGQPICTGRER